MSVNPVEYACINVQGQSRDVSSGRLTLIEFDGTNAGDIETWLNGNSITGVPWREDSGDFFLTVNASGNYPNQFPAGLGKPVEYQLQSGDRLLIHHIDLANFLIGVFDEGQASEIAELA